MGLLHFPHFLVTLATRTGRGLVLFVVLVLVLVASEVLLNERRRELVTVPRNLDFAGIR